MIVRCTSVPDDSRLTSRKKKVALLALRAAWGSSGSVDGASFCAGSTGVVLRALMSFGRSMKCIELQQRRVPNLLQRFVVDKMGSVLGDFELPLLDMLPELPVRKARDVNMAQDDRLQTHRTAVSHGEA